MNFAHLNLRNHPNNDYLLLLTIIGYFKKKPKKCSSYSNIYDFDNSREKKVSFEKIQ